MSPVRLSRLFLAVLLTPVAIRGQESIPDPGSDLRAFMRAYAEAWSSSDADRVLDFFTEDIVYEDVPNVDNGWETVSRGKEAVRRWLVEDFAAMPDFGLEIHSVRTTDNGAAVEWTMTGTQTGDYPGLPASGRSISIRGASFMRFEGGKIAWNRDYYDMYLFLTQLGAVSLEGGA
jgi:steroid delta-isomerase-like uncharacterized protein